jgi:hypothetical protein
MREGSLSSLAGIAMDLCKWQNRTSRRIQMDISEGLRKFCYDRVYRLASAYNLTLSDGLEYEEGFSTVADILNIPQEAREDIFLEVLWNAKVAGIPYYELSPINQFIVAIPPYVLYCIANELTGDSNLNQEATMLKDDVSFYRYLQEEIGFNIAQEVKGALWKPRLFGLGKLLDSVSSLRYRKSRKQGEKVDTIIRGLDLILETLFIELVDIYKSEYPTDAEETNLMRAGTVLNELVIEELRGEQTTFKEKNADFIEKEKTRLLKLDRIRKRVLTFLAAKGAFYKDMNSSKAMIWVNGAKELDPMVIIPDSLDKVIESIEEYSNNLPRNDK